MQWLAVVLGVAEVLFAIYDNIWLYPTGIAGTIIAIYLLLTVQLYADSALNVYYLVMSVYGWVHWRKNKQGPEVLVSWSSKNEWLISLSIAIGGWLILYMLLKNLTPSNVPVWDALVSSTAWAGMWLLAKRKIENWIFLNVSNLFAIPLLFYKQLPLFAALTLFLFVIAFAGLYKWIKICKTNKWLWQFKIDPMKIEHPAALLDPGMVKTIRELAFKAERLGKIHPDQLAIIYEQKWFKLLVPAVYSGLEKSIPELVRLEESISWANGSLGWVVTLCCGAGWFGGFIDAQKAIEICSSINLCLAGSGAATGEAMITPNGYKISGKWEYASGAHHATHFTANCIIKNGDEVMLDEDGNPLILPFIFECSKIKILPAWKYTGMVATGSDAFAVQDIEVSTKHCFKIDPNATIVNTPLYQYPFLQLAEATLAVNISGMAIHFMDICAAIFAKKRGQVNLSSLQKDLLKGLWIKQENKLRKVRKSFYSAVDNSWVKLVKNGEPDEATMESVSKTSRLLAKTARECVDTLYPYCGLIAANTESEINQVWRDLHTASQHSLLTFL